MWLDLLMTDVPDLVRVAVGAPLGSSDDSSLSIAISMAQAIPNLCVSKRVLLKHRVNWSAVCDAIGVLPWRSIWSAMALQNVYGIAACNTWRSGGTALCRVGGATSQLDLPSLAPLSVAGCG